jgi:hypothetical protein
VVVGGTVPLPLTSTTPPTNSFTSDVDISDSQWALRRIRQIADAALARTAAANRWSGREERMGASVCVEAWSNVAATTVPFETFTDLRQLEPPTFSRTASSKPSR